MKKITKRVISFLISMVMVISLFPTGVMAASGKGPSNGYCYIQIEKSETERSYIFFPKAGESGKKVEKVSGFSYDKKTNTLTIKNVKKPKWILNVNEMGTDFKIKVVGTNELYGVVVWGYYYGGCVEFTGTGKLTINKSKTRAEAITMNAEQSKAVLKVGKKVTLNAYAGKNSKNSVAIYDGTVKKASDAMKFLNGTSTKKVKTKKTPVVKTEEFAFQTDFGDAGIFEYSDYAILLSKKGSQKQYAAHTNSETGGWLIYEISEDIGEATGFPIAKLLGTSDDFEKDGYKPTVTGYVYTHTYSGNLLLKAKQDGGLNMSKRWKINVKRIVACAMSATLMITLFPLAAEAQTAKRKAVKYVDDFSKRMLVEADGGLILFPKDSYSGKKAVSEGPEYNHTCHCDTSPGPVDHYECFGFKFIGDVKDVNITKQSSEIIVGKEAGAFEYEEVTYDGKLTAKDKIVRLTYAGRGEIIINYSKCNQGNPYDKYTYSIGTKVNVESLPATAYKLKYDLKGGKVSSKKNLPTKIELTPEDQVVSFEMPTKKGYSFLGWDFYNAAGEQIWPEIYGYAPNSLIVSGLLENANWDRVKDTISGTITAKARWYKKTYSKGDSFSDSVYLKGTGMYYNVTNAWYKITSAKYGAMKVTCLGDKAYGSCSDTTDIVIGEKVYWGAPFTVTAIADNAFNSDYSSKIKTITIKSTKITKMGKNAFAGLKKSAVIKVPKKMQKKYTTMLKKSGFKGKVKTI